jgi:RimJ/RimL family protein N-acetyltransferase
VSVLTGAVTITTPRLLLRQWREDDLAPFAALNRDPEVMRFFEEPLGAERSDAWARALAAAIDEQGWGLWALERRDTGEFIGFTGLQVPRHPLPFLPCVEVGWRLARPAWGHGFATEAGTASLAHAFGPLGLSEVVSMTAVPNVPSRRVMERLGMARDEHDDFDHPAVSTGHPLRRHVLYRITAEQWEAQAAT